MGADGHELVKPVQVGELCPYRGNKRVKAPKPPGPYARGWQQNVKTTLKNAELNKVSLNSFCSDVFKNVKGKFDIIIFNSPYLPKDNYEKDIKESIQWSNEKALKLFLSDFKNYLNKKGFALLLISSITNIDEIELNKFKYNIVSRKKIDWEELKILKLEP